MSARATLDGEAMTRADVARALGMHVDTVIRLERRALRRLSRVAALREFATERADRARVERGARRARRAPDVDHDEPTPDEQPAQTEADEPDADERDAGGRVHVLDALFDPYVTDEAACAVVFELYERHSREWDDDR